jgi:hypothetical protein
VIDWREHAACKGVHLDVFFPGGGDNYRTARTYCVRCPVRPACLKAAMAEEDPASRHGMRGGLDPFGRAALRKLRRTAA